MIVVLIETDPSGALDVSLETVTFARSLAAAGGGVPVDALLVGPLDGQVEEACAKQLAEYGVRTVYRATGEAFDAFSGAAWAAAVQAAQAASGAVVLTGAGTERGNEVFAHVAARVQAPMAANVIAFSGLAPFVVTRQVVGGAALEEMRLGMRPAIFTVAGHAVEPQPAETPGAATFQPLEVAVADRDLVARVVSTEAPPADESGSLKSAKVVIGAGRGAGGPDGFGPVEELSELLHASLGVSRVATSLGWRPHHEQVGQTGSRISPDLYVACGISGAIQHWAGCSSSKTILAINTDDEAPMVTKAHYAVIGDMHEIVPAINEELRRRRS